MSVFVSDILKLPVMQGAELLGGKSALSKIVSAVTVLEYAAPEILHEVFRGKDYYRNEIGLTGFCNNPEDVELQVACIRKMAAEGEVGLILFYVGSFMPEVDPKLIAAADESDFALICMPRKNMSLRYSDVIYEIMELIFKDQGAQHSFVYDILDYVAGLKKDQRNLYTVLSMLKDELTASLVLTDASHNVLYHMNWRDTKADYQFSLEDDFLPVADGIPIRYEADPSYWIYRLLIRDKRNTGTELFIFRKNETLEEEQRSQAAELVRLAVSIWDDRQGEEVIAELIRAILNDEPAKMRRLANLFQVDVTAISSMWVLHKDDDRFSEKDIKELKNIISQYTNVIAEDYYENDYVIFSGNLNYRDEQELRQGLTESGILKKSGIASVYCGNLENTVSAKSAYGMICKNIREACHVFGNRSLYTLNDISYIEECKSVMEQGEKHLEQILEPIQCLEECRQKEFLETLAVYLLDAEMSVQRTGELMYLHKNTVKYRLQRIAELTGIRPGEMPGTIRLYKAVVVKRLLDR